MMHSRRWKLAVGGVLLSICSMAASAQSGEPQGPPPGSHERRGGPGRELQILTQRLVLTAEQQAGVKSLLEQQATQMRALRGKGQGDTEANPEARRTQMDQIRDETNTKTSALLNEDQKKTFAEWVAKRKAEMEKRRAEGDGPPPPPPNE